MARIVGGCLCGNVRYAGTADPLSVMVCHCKNCQKQTSTAFSLIVALSKGTLAIKGELSAYHDQGTSGQAVVRCFCGACGSAIMTDAAAYPAMEFLKAGTLDDTSWLKPDTQFWCDSAQGWLKLVDDIAQLARNPSLE